MTTQPLQTADGTPLKVALARAQRRAKLRAFWLVFPLLAFVVLSFIVPIFQMLERSANNTMFSKNAPALAQWGIFKCDNNQTRLKALDFSNKLQAIVDVAEEKISEPKRESQVPEKRA